MKVISKIMTLLAGFAFVTSLDAMVTRSRVRQIPRAERERQAQDQALLAGEQISTVKGMIKRDRQARERQQAVLAEQLAALEAKRNADTKEAARVAQQSADAQKIAHAAMRGASDAKEASDVVIKSWQGLTPTQIQQQLANQGVSLREQKQLLQQLTPKRWHKICKVLGVVAVTASIVALAYLWLVNKGLIADLGAQNGRIRTELDGTWSALAQRGTGYIASGASWLYSNTLGRLG